MREKRAEPQAYRVVLKDPTWLRDGDRPVHLVERHVHLLGFLTGGKVLIPLGGRDLRASPDDVLDSRPLRTEWSHADVDEANTMRLTCRYCGAWLSPSDDGYGGEYGHCGCAE
jgi:hypothetical protein